MDPKRVVDVILGILGIVTGKVDLFEKELFDRQNPDQVREVLNSLHSLKKAYRTQTQMSQKSVTISGDSSNQIKTKQLDSDV